MFTVFIGVGFELYLIFFLDGRSDFERINAVESDSVAEKRIFGSYRFNAEPLNIDRSDDERFYFVFQFNSFHSRVLYQISPLNTGLPFTKISSRDYPNTIKP